MATMPIMTLTEKTEMPDGELTPHGMKVAQQYAVKWVQGFERDFALENAHPELAGLFQDIRHDSELALAHSIPTNK